MDVLSIILLLIALGAGVYVGKTVLGSRPSGVGVQTQTVVEEAKQRADEIIREAKEKAEQILKEAKETAQRVLREAEQKAEKLIREAKEEVEKIKEEVERRKKELKEREESLQAKERHLDRRWEALDRREEELLHRERELKELERSLDSFRAQLREREEELQREKKEVEELKQKELEELQRIARLTIEEARQEILKRVEEEAKRDAVKLMKVIEEDARRKAEFEAKKIIATATQRLSPQIAINYTTTTVELPSNEFKGRIIGREGRNIRTFEILTGVDLIIDDTPDVVTISSFDPLRREMAKEALQRLIADGRIHPARIEEVVDEVKREFDEKIRKIGEETVYELDLHDINPGLYYYIGKLYFRTSYSQNVLLHSKEVAYLAGLMAEELGLDAKLARRAGLLHDIGKAISHELGGSHTDIGVELAKKYGEPDAVINAIKAHHDEEPVRYPEVALVCAADALSAARPGARRETLEAYIKRLEKLEEIVKSFKGVANAYAVQAGREVRVIVNPEEISDEEAYLLSKEIAKKIEEELDFPGQIKVVVIRETRHVEYAR
ncbi:MAG: ribonuclease Y [Aquificae bacterium]|nr:ribonuclease Y [Aquificota bacterium]